MQEDIHAMHIYNLFVDSIVSFVLFSVVTLAGSLTKQSMTYDLMDTQETLQGHQPC